MGTSFKILPNLAQINKNKGSNNVKNSVQSSEYSALKDYYDDAMLAQKKVRFDLKNSMDSMKKILGSVSQTINNAENLMQEAEKWLGKKDLNEAIHKQVKVLDNLRAGLENTSEKISKRLKRGSGKTSGLRMGQNGNGNME